MTDTSNALKAADARSANRDEPEPRPARSPEEISADMEVARERLATNVGAIKDKVNPAHAARRKVKRLKRVYVSDSGQINVRNVAITAAVVSVLVLYRIRK